MRKVILYIAWIILLLALQACTKENLDGCFYGLRLRVSYAFEDVENTSPADIRHVRAYVFNENDVLCAIAEEKGSWESHSYTMDIGVAPGKYKILVWGSNDTDLSLSYGEGQRGDVAGQSYTEGIAVGKTTLSDFRIFLKGTMPNDANPEFSLDDPNYDDLYYGAAGHRMPETSEYVVKEVTVPESTIVEENVLLIKDTHELTVSITGLSNLIRKVDTESFDDVASAYILSKGHVYNWDNTFAANDYDVKFTPFASIEDTDDLVAYNIRLQRIRWDMMSEKPLMLYLYDKARGKAVYSLDLMESIVKARDANGDFLYENQEDLDKTYSHKVELEFIRPSGGSDLIVGITIDGWKVVNLHPVPN